MTAIKTVSDTCTLTDIPAQKRYYLEEMMLMPAKRSKERIGMRYEHAPDEYVFIRDAFVCIEHNRKFIERGIVGLWLTGAAGIVRTKHGVLATYDDRITQWKPAPIGWASPDDGADLMACLRREAEEEIVVFSLDRKHQYVAKGVTPQLAVPSFGIHKLEAAIEHGEFSPLRICKKPGVLVLHGLWDIRDLPDNISVASDDEWWQGGFFGANVVTIGTDGRITGYYSGQQGFVDLRTCTADVDLTAMVEALELE